MLENTSRSSTRYGLVERSEVKSEVASSNSVSAAANQVEGRVSSRRLKDGTVKGERQGSAGAQRTSQMVVHARPEPAHDGAVGLERALEFVDDVVQAVARGVDLKCAVDVEEEERDAAREEREGRFELCVCATRV